MSTQSKAMQNRSTMVPRRVTISAKRSSNRPIPRTLVLCTIATKRSTCSPLVQTLEGQVPEVDLEQGQVMPRCLDHDAEARRQVVGLVAGPLLGAEQRAQGGDIEAGSGPLNTPLLVRSTRAHRVRTQVLLGDLNRPGFDGGWVLASSPGWGSRCRHGSGSGSE